MARKEPPYSPASRGPMEGVTEILRNLDALEARMFQGVLGAADEIAMLLANYAKEHHGMTSRAAGWVYPGAGVKRWREAGIGWGDVTGNLQQSTVGEIAEVTRDYVMVALSAGMSYAVFVEFAHQGKWAWLWPAVEANEDKMMSILNRHLEGAIQ